MRATTTRKAAPARASAGPRTKGRSLRVTLASKRIRITAVGGTDDRGKKKLKARKPVVLEFSRSEGGPLLGVLAGLQEAELILHRPPVETNARSRGDRYSKARQVRRTLQRREKRARGTKPIEAVIADLVKDVPAEEWNKLPRDLSENLDHYLYGAPKR